MILLTAFDQEETLASLARQAGIDAFLGKPVSHSMLFDTIMELFAQQSPRRSHAKGVEDNRSTIMQQIGGARVLLVEDMPINQQVAKELLEGVGLKVTIAHNGAAAVRMVEQNDYDVVLMDIQMPVMDGYEATQAIRGNPRFEHLPIIAMTAHAMASDRAKCSAVGMNDHISKPIDPKRLFNLLTTLIKPGAQGMVGKDAPKTTPIATPNVTPLPEMPGFDSQSAMDRVLGNQTLLKQLWLEFAHAHATASEEIRSALSKDDPEGARRIAHQIKGISGNIGARQLHDAASALEKAIKQAQTNEWAALTTAFATALEETLTVIGSMQPPPLPAAAPDSTPVASQVRDNSIPKPVLQRLARQLSLFEQDAVHSFNQVKTRLQASGFGHETEQMEALINNYDFLAARIILMDVLQALNIPIQDPA
ncbi:MAG: response regulator [Magnetococcus sp. YQC-5]